MTTPNPDLSSHTPDASILTNHKQRPAADHQNQPTPRPTLEF